MVTAEALSISDAAQATGLSVHTLRYYERAGLMLDPVERAPRATAATSEDEIRWVTLLTRLRATGMPIRRIRDYADLVRAGDGNEDERLALLEAHRAARPRAARDHAQRTSTRSSSRSSATASGPADARGASRSHGDPGAPHAFRGPAARNVAAPRGTRRRP